MTDSEHKRLHGGGENPKKSLEISDIFPVEKMEMLLCFAVISVSSWCLSYECSI